MLHFVRRPRAKVIVVLGILFALVLLNISMSVSLGQSELLEIDLVKARDVYKDMVGKIKDAASNMAASSEPNEDDPYANMEPADVLHAKYVDPLDVKADRERFWKFDLDIGDFHSVVVSEEEWSNTEVFRYDPRVTYSVYLNYINKNAGKPVPFSWSDWMDFTPLNKFITLPDAEKPKCNDMMISGERLLQKYSKRDSFLARPKKESQRKNPPRNREEFCYDDKQYLEKFPERANKKLPGFNFHHRSTKATFPEKVVFAKSYMNAMAPLPKSIIFTSHHDVEKGKLYQVEVDQTQQSTDMFDSGMFHEYSQEHRLEDGMVRFDPTQEFVEMTRNVEPLVPFRNLDENPEIELDPELFVFNPREIVVEYERLSNMRELTPREQLHYESLKYSLGLQANQIPKHFYEVNIHWPAQHNGHKVTENGGHYDWRFFNGFVSEGSLDPILDGNNEDRRRMILHRMLKSWLSFTHEAGVLTWIAHGTLLAWYWDGHSFPWDDDIDVSMPIEELNRFSLHFNQSVVVSDLDVGFGKYFIDCGSFMTHRIKGNGRNNIDARFIDMDSGLFIDITGLALTTTPINQRYFKNGGLKLSVQKDEPPLKQLEQNKRVQAYNCRNNHFYLHEELSPLRLTMADGSLALIPNKYEDILRAEYSRGLTADKFNKHVYLPVLKLWIPMATVLNMKQQGAFKPLEDAIPELKERAKKGSNLNSILKQRHTLLFNEILLQNDDILREFYLTEKATNIHDKEMVLAKKGPHDEYIEYLRTFKPLKPSRKDPFVFRQEVLAWKQT